MSAGTSMNTSTTGSGTEVADSPQPELFTRAAAHVMPTYGPPKVAFVRGQGTMLFDADGEAWLDFLSGLAVTSLGHAHPAVTEAVARQAATLMHTSNLFLTEPAVEDVRLRHPGADRCNDGAHLRAHPLVQLILGEHRLEPVDAELADQRLTLRVTEVEVEAGHVGEVHQLGGP